MTMTQFEYTARDASGEMVRGAIEGPTLDDVATKLLSTGVTPVRIEEKRAAKTDLLHSIPGFLKRGRLPDISDKIMFCRQMYSLLKSGVPINRSINGIMRSTRNGYFSNVLKIVLNDLESGQELSSSISKFPRIFSPLFIAMIKVGENTGHLDQAFLQISEYMERDKETHNQIKSALRYPSFVLIAIGIAIAVINTMVIPAFAKVFKDAKVELPLPTQFLIFTSDTVVNFWPYMLTFIIIAFFGFKQWLKTEAGAFQWDGFLLRLPLIGGIITRAVLSRFARSFAMTVRAGVTLTQALTVIAQVVDNHYISSRVLEIRSAVEHGSTLSQAAIATNMFTPLVIQMLSVGEESGAVDTMMFEVAEFYEREVSYDVKNLSSAIEPVLITVIGIMVLILALGIFLPMWDLSNIAN